MHAVYVSKVSKSMVFLNTGIKVGPVRRNTAHSGIHPKKVIDKKNLCSILLRNLHEMEQVVIIETVSLF